MPRPTILKNLPLTGITYNGVNLYDHGFVAHEPPDGRGLAAIRENHEPLPAGDRSAEFLLDYNKRSLRLTGTAIGDTLSQLQENLDGLKRLFSSRSAQKNSNDGFQGLLHFGDQNSRGYPVIYGGSLTVRKIVPWRRSLVAELEIEFSVPESFASAHDPTTHTTVFP